MVRPNVMVTLPILQAWTTAKVTTPLLQERVAIPLAPLPPPTPIL